MSLNKAIEHGKEKRKPYTGGKAVDKTCRNHGGCDWCKSNRLYQRYKAESAAEEQMKEVIEDVELASQETSPLNGEPYGESNENN